LIPCYHTYHESLVSGTIHIYILDSKARDGAELKRAYSLLFVFFHNGSGQV